VVPIVATNILLLLHVPPAVASAWVTVVPLHNTFGPVIASGVANTVMTALAVQPSGRAVTIVAVPANTPVTTPVVAPTLAMVVGVLLQVIPVVTSLNVMVEPSHTDDGPVIGAGVALTVTITVAWQPPLNEYDIVAVPGIPPVMIPVVPMLATVALLLPQLPPAVASVTVIVDPLHTTVGPAIATGDGFTATTIVALQPPTV
jgi:hypothetical protein